MTSHPSARAALRSLAAAVGLSLLAACGSVAAPAGQPEGATLPVHPSLGPPGGTRAQATGLAGRMLGRLRLPPGAHLVGGHIPAALRYAPLYAGAISSVDMHKIYSLASPPATVLAAVSAGRPTGMVTAGTSGGSNVQSVSFAPRSLPGWAYSAQLVVEVTAGQDGTTLLRADAQVQAYPWRSAAEYLRPWQYHVLTIVVTIDDTHPHSRRVVLTSAAQIAGIAALLNGSRAEAMRTEMCPMIFASYQITFAASRNAHGAVVLRFTKWPCLGTEVQVDGRKQPSLQVGEALVSVADRLLGYTPGP